MTAHNHHRHSIRLRGYDYTREGAYFVTICTWQREPIFGEIIRAEMHLSAWGEIAARQWQRLPQRFHHIDCAAFVVMPNHVHAILVIKDTVQGTGGRPPAALDDPRPGNSIQVAPGSLGAIIRAYKGAVTSRVNVMRGSAAPPLWQRNYYEHIIRNAGEMEHVYQYIQANPARWSEDQLYRP